MGFAIQDQLYSQHGFCVPIPSTWSAPKTSQRNRRHLFQLGNVLEETHMKEADIVVDTIMYSAADTFFEAISNRKEPPQGIWDLYDSCPRYVRAMGRYSRVYTIEIPPHEDVKVKQTYSSDKKHYYAFVPVHPTERWVFATLSASAALTLCRLPPDFKEYDIAFFFAQRGIPFRIFYPKDKLTRRHPRMPIQYLLPIRPFDHVFTKADYNAYVTMRTMLLAQSHMQAVLKRGGIAWRLAITTLGLNSVTRSPSLFNEFEQITINKVCCVDDALTEAELDLLCGAYECVSADGKQRSLKSWWPLVRYFEKEECGYNHGHWSEANEHWYSKRLADIENGTTKTSAPATYTEWKSRLHGAKPIRNFLMHVEKRSRDTLLRQASL